MRFDPDEPYNDLASLPPKAELETKAVLRKAIAASKALAELKGAGELIPNQGVLICAAIEDQKAYAIGISPLPCDDRTYQRLAKLRQEGQNKSPLSVTF